MYGDFEIRNIHKEEELAKQRKPGEVITYKMDPAELKKRLKELEDKRGEVITYKMDPAELEKKYPTNKQDKKNVGMALHHFNWRKGVQRKEGGNEEMKINMKIVEEELKKGLNKDEIIKKYNTDPRAVGMLISRVQNKKKNETKEIHFTVETMDVQGKVFKYRIQNDQITIKKGNQSIKVEKSEVDNIINELQQFKGMILNG